MVKIVKGKYTQNINQYQVIFIQHHPYLPGHMCPPCNWHLLHSLNVAEDIDGPSLNSHGYSSFILSSDVLKLKIQC
jgi:hypothetical protein